MIELQITTRERRRVSFTNVPDEALPAIKNYILQKIGRPTNVPKKLELIFKTVCQTQKVDPAHLIKRTRKREIVLARQFFCWLAHEKYCFFLVDIARHLNQDHTTVLHSVRKFQDMLDIQDQLAINTLTATAPKLLAKYQHPQKSKLIS
jgi:chromosomal replication initiation ATPase DnaA